MTAQEQFEEIMEKLTVLELKVKEVLAEREALIAENKMLKEMLKGVIESVEALGKADVFLDQKKNYRRNIKRYKN